MSTLSTQNNSQKSTLSEHILVVPRTLLFEPGLFQGFSKLHIDSYVDIIQREKLFLPRWEMEQNPHYKQIIPYIVFRYHNNYFLMQRSAQASEQRLKNKYTLGIGGHIRKEDMDHTTVFAWAQREFHEEVHYTGSLSITPFGVINDDSNDVGRVHFALVLLLEGDRDDIRIKSELAHGTLVSLQECIVRHQEMESWSSTLLPYLQTSS